jgi:hypothetical protein
MRVRCDTAKVCSDGKLLGAVVADPELEMCRVSPIGGMTCKKYMLVAECAFNHDPSDDDDRLELLAPGDHRTS